MGKRHMTNVEKVTHIMERSRHGALAQMFVMDALHKLADAVSKATPEQIGKHGLINAEAWIATAQEVKELLAKDMMVEDDDYDDDDDDDSVYSHDDENIYGREEFAHPGGNSALRAASKSNPRNLPCPTCRAPNRLTPKDKALGYQCDTCADRAESGRDY